jgi:hypothetical protein
MPCNAWHNLPPVSVTRETAWRCTNTITVRNCIRSEYQRLHSFLQQIFFCSAPFPLPLPIGSPWARWPISAVVIPTGPWFAHRAGVSVAIPLQL